MIYYVCREQHLTPVRRLLDSGSQAIVSRLRPLTWERLFFERSAPVGHYIFTDFDRLSAYEREIGAGFAVLLAERVPEARILNHPGEVLERFPLLRAWHAAGLNDYDAVRLEDGGRPARYPAFIRFEQEFAGPETAILEDEAAFDAALADLARRGKPLRGRIAVGFMARPDENGFFRKYGAFRIGDAIVPQHLLTNRNWVVKSPGRHGHEAAYEALELAWIRDNPHKDELLRAFDIARIRYGRMDYTVIDGRLQFYEINTNATPPNFTMGGGRAERRGIIRKGFEEAFAAIDTPIRSTGRLPFTVPSRNRHVLLAPRRGLAGSLVRRSVHALGLMMRERSLDAWRSRE